VGITLPSAMNRFGIPRARWSESTTLRSLRAHPAAAHEVRVAVREEHVLGVAGLEDLVQGLLGEGDVLAVVVALRVPARVGFSRRVDDRQTSAGGVAC
jgi:hypothetical protein